MRSMKTYARHATKFATGLERCVAIKPKDPIPETYVNDLEKILQTTR